MEGLRLIECHLSQVDAHYEVLNFDDVNGICSVAPTPEDSPEAGAPDPSRLLESIEEPSCCLLLDDSQFSEVVIP